MQHVLHIDMDAFYASVEVRDHPEWAGKPLVVGSPPDKRGVVSTCSYEARVYGIRSAMPSRTAYRLCPQAIFVPVRMSRYLDESERIMGIIHTYSPIVEQLSVDEAFVDIGGVMRRWKTPIALAEDLKRTIREKTGLTASVGLAPNKFLAKLASDLDKPDGLTVVPCGQPEREAFLATLPVARIWGVGRRTEETLREAGFRTVRDIQGVSEVTLVQILGPALAEHVHRLAHGVDTREVITESEARSISAEHTFDEDVEMPGIVRRQLVGLVEQVGRRLRKSGFYGRTISIKLRYEDFQTVSRQVSLENGVCSDQVLLSEALKLFSRENIARPIRLVGFGVSGLSATAESVPQLDLFQKAKDEASRRSRDLDRAVDAIKDRLGSQAIGRASGMRPDGD